MCAENNTSSVQTRQLSCMAKKTTECTEIRERDKNKKKKEYMTKPTEMETQGAEGKNAFFSSSSPLGDLGAFGDQNTEAETTNTGALSNAGEQGFLKACTKSHRSALENTHRSRQWHQLCCLHYEETNHFAQ